MKKNLLALLLLGCLAKAKSQTAIALQHGATTFIESRLDTAIAHAQNGDVIYLPGGLIAGSENVSINRKLTIIGAGYRPDSSQVTSPTKISGNVTFTSGSDGSLISGVYLLNHLYMINTNVNVTRSNVYSVFMDGALTNVLIEENIIRGYFWGGAASLSGIVVRKNLFYGLNIGPSPFFRDLNGGITFSNNIYLATSYFDHVQSCLFRNNIFVVTPGFSNSSNLQFDNNLFTDNPAVSGSGNIINEPIANIFNSYTLGAAWNITQNFHLSPACNGINAGNDGTDIGIYGSSTPFKDGALPLNPHFQSAAVPGNANAGGQLNINITVRAQNH
jgi:hypothetical protein